MRVIHAGAMGIDAKHADQQSKMADHQLSRRQACVAFGLAALTALVGRRSQAAASADDEALIYGIIRARGRLPQRVDPYLLTRPLVLPAGAELVIEAGVRIVFRPATTPTTFTGVFQAAGDGVTVAVDAGEATVECAMPSFLVYAASARAVDGFVVKGLRGINCNHVMVEGGPPGGGYAEIITAGVGANAARNIRIEGGGARFLVRPTAGHAACLLRYVKDWTVTGCSYDDTLSGVEWWGGDANPVTGQGAAANQRKCGRFIIRNVTTRNTTISGIWGSMGHDGIVTDCLINRAGDVGFDAEGSSRITFRNCTAYDGANGCFGTFFLNTDVMFENCRAFSSRKELPVFRVHNPTLNMAENRRIVIRGGHWECRDPSGPSTIDTAGGPCGEITIEQAELVNVRIDTAFVGVHTTRVLNNRVTFPFAFAGKAAIRTGGSKTLGSPAPGTVLIAGNFLTSSAPTTAAGIELFEDDPISSASAVIRDNVLAGSFKVGVRIVNGSPNPAVAPRVEFAGNRFKLYGAAFLSSLASRPRAPLPVVTWRSGRAADGRAISAAAALGF